MPINSEGNSYVGYLNNDELFIESMYDEKKNPNGIGKIKLCVNSSMFFSGSGSNGANAFYREIFGSELKNSYISESTTQDSKNYTKIIKFIINDDIQFGGGNKWEASIQSVIDGTFGKKVSDYISENSGEFKPKSLMSRLFKNKFSALGGAAQAGAALGGIKFQTLMQTVKFWNGSNDPGPFTFRFNILATSPDMDVRRDLLALYASVYPISLSDAYGNALFNAGYNFSQILPNIASGNFMTAAYSFFNATSNLNSGAFSGFIAAPLGYNPVDGYVSSLSPVTKDGSGLIDMRIGKWIHIPNLLARSFNASISKVTTRFGFPLYASCSLELVPVRMWTIADIYDSFYSTATSNESSTGFVANGSVRNRNTGKLDEGKITKVRVGDMP